MSLYPNGHSTESRFQSFLDAAAEAMVEHLADAELNLLEALLPRPALWPLAQAEGIRLKHLRSQDDHLAIAVALDEGHCRGTLHVLKLAKLALQQFRLWDDRQIAGNVGASMIHSHATLEFLSDRPTTPDLVRLRARQLLDLHRQMVRMRALERELMNASDPTALRFSTSTLRRTNTFKLRPATFAEAVPL